MNQIKAEAELQWRFYCWAKKFMEKGVAEGFPVLRACDLNRRVQCFLAWINYIDQRQQLSVSLAMVKQANQNRLAGRAEAFTSSDKELLETHGNAHDLYHDKLPPTPDCDRYSPKFVKADAQKSMEAIIEHLHPICGKPRKRLPQKLWYRHQFGEWVFVTHIEIRRLLGPTVDCYSFLWRSDFERKTFPEKRIYVDDLIVRLDPLMMTGVSWSQFPLISQRHEQLSARCVRAVIEMLLPSVPKLVDGLGISD
jgi:hypothetical protein